MVEHKRINLTDVEKSIFRPNEVENTTKTDLACPNIIVYTVKGQQDEFDEQNCPVLNDSVYDRNGKKTVVLAEDLEEAYAKQVFKQGTKHYFAKTNGRGDLYNQYDLYAEGNAKKTRPNGEPIWKWQEVTQRVFELYLSFLKTGNRAWHANAQRANR